MPWRLIVFLIALTIFALFAGFNIDNTADISLGFHTFTGVPIFISLFFAFLLGAIVVLPFSFGRRLKKRSPVPKIKAGRSKKGPEGASTEQAEDRTEPSESVTPAVSEQSTVGEKPVEAPQRGAGPHRKGRGSAT